MKEKKLVNFFFEILSLKNVSRSGWSKVGIKNPESVAEHSFCATQISYFLAKMEKVNPEKVVLMALFHDNGEARVGDLNLIQQKYLSKKNPEKKAFLEQIEQIQDNKEIKAFYQEYLAQKTLEAKIVHDADKLELCLQAKFYIDQGFKSQLWIDNVRNSLKTKSAKKLLKIIEKTDANEWWQKIPFFQKRIKEIKKQKKQ